jgi:AraC-like DNA-binding protein
MKFAVRHPGGEAVDVDRRIRVRTPRRTPTQKQAIRDFAILALHDPAAFGGCRPCWTVADLADAFGLSRWTIRRAIESMQSLRRAVAG